MGERRGHRAGSFRAGPGRAAPFRMSCPIAASATFQAVGARVVRFTMPDVHPRASQPDGVHVETAGDRA